MVNWVAFAAFVAVVAGAVAWGRTRLGRLQEEWDDRAAAVRAASWPQSTLTVVSHVCADGEVLEFPTSFAFPWFDVAETLAAIERLPEVAA